MKKNIIILGASGFTGQHFASFLEKIGVGKSYNLVLVDLNKTDGVKQSYALDATNSKELIQFLKKKSPSIIINLMGILRGESFSDFYRCNVEVSQTLMEYALQCEKKIEKILLIGSAAEYGYVESNPVDEDYPKHPISHYGMSKLIQGELAKYYYRRFGVPVIVARTFNLTGEGISKNLAIGAWREKIDKAKIGETLEFGNLNSYRDYMTIEEVVAIYWKLIQKAPAGEIYNVCSGRPIQMRTILDQMIKISEKSITINIDPSLFKIDDLPIIYGNNTKLNDFLNSI